MKRAAIDQFVPFQVGSFLVSNFCDCRTHLEKHHGEPGRIFSPSLLSSNLWQAKKSKKSSILHEGNMTSVCYGISRFDGAHWSGLQVRLSDPRAKSDPPLRTSGSAPRQALRGRHIGSTFGRVSEEKVWKWPPFWRWSDTNPRVSGVLRCKKHKKTRKHRRSRI